MPEDLRVTVALGDLPEHRVPLELGEGAAPISRASDRLRERPPGRRGTRPAGRGVDGNKWRLIT